jgi:hypothetical protein
MQSDLGDILGGLAAALLALGLVVVMARLAHAAFDIAAPRDAEAVPLLRLLAIWTGAALGAALLLAAPDRAIFEPWRVLAADGPWAGGVAALVGTHGLPRAGAFAALPGALAGGDFAVAFLAWLALLGLLHGVITALRLWDGAARRRALGAFVLLGLHTALLVHLGLHLAGWFAAQLGPWSLALALIAFQRWRYRPHGVH